MKVITAPGSVDPMTDERPYVFLAGGISNCPDWQRVLIKSFGNASCTIINPRRANFPMGDKKEGLKQIIWEEFMINKVADIIGFYFPKETLCPITLFELGTQLMRDIPMAISIEGEYKREFDVWVQTLLKRNDISVNIGNMTYDSALGALNDYLLTLVEVYRNENFQQIQKFHMFRRDL